MLLPLNSSGPLPSFPITLTKVPSPFNTYRSGFGERGSGLRVKAGMWQEEAQMRYLCRKESIQKKPGSDDCPILSPKCCRDRLQLRPTDRQTVCACEVASVCRERGREKERERDDILEIFRQSCLKKYMGVRKFTSWALSLSLSLPKFST